MPKNGVFCAVIYCRWNSIKTPVLSNIMPICIIDKIGNKLLKLRVIDYLPQGL
jgi:hypothetical protein